MVIICIADLLVKELLEMVSEDATSYAGCTLATTREEYQGFREQQSQKIQSN